MAETRDNKAYIRSRSRVIHSDPLMNAFDFQKLETGGLYLGKKRENDLKIYSLEELRRDLGFDLVPWDGM